MRKNFRYETKFNAFVSIREVWIFLLLLLISCITIIILSTETSPLYIVHSIDSSIFITMGNAFVDGQIPYKDFFDHKGFVLILIQAIPQIFISGKDGFIYLQIFNLFFSLLLLFKTAQHFVSSTKAFISIFVFLLLFRITINGGNSSEEYTLLFSCLSLYITAPFIINKKITTISKWQSFTLGICFALVFWIRVNNAGVISACILFLIISCIKYKEWKALGKLILFSASGLLLISVLISAYFIYHDAFYDMIYATFLFNMKYASDYEFMLRGKYIVVNALTIISLLTGCILYYKRTKNAHIILFSSLLFLMGVMTANLGRFYIHYLILILPVFFLGLTLILAQIKTNRYIPSIVAILLTIYTGFSFSRIYTKNQEKDKIKPAIEYKSNAFDIISEIPENEKKSLFGYMVEPKFYMLTGTLPYFKYFILQEFHGQFDKNILIEINEMMVRKTPKWVVLEQESLINLENKAFIDILKNDYILTDSNETFSLYKNRDI